MTQLQPYWEVRVRRDDPYTGRIEFTEAELFADGRRTAIRVVLERVGVDDGRPVTSVTARCPFGETAGERRRYLRRKAIEVVSGDRQRRQSDGGTERSGAPNRWVVVGQTA